MGMPLATTRFCKYSIVIYHLGLVDHPTIHTILLYFTLWYNLTVDVANLWLEHETHIRAIAQSFNNTHSPPPALDTHRGRAKTTDVFL